MLVRISLVTLICGFLCSCASVSVRDTKHVKGSSAKRLPTTILIKPFEYHDETQTVRVDRSGEELETFKFDQQEKLTRHLVRRISRSVAPAKAVAAKAPLPKGNYWLITGRFDRINQGSRFMRSFVGMGAGGTKLETTVIVHELSTGKPRPFLIMTTTGGSNISPGVLGVATIFFSGPSALLNAGNALEGIRSGVTFDTIRTSREITAALSEYLYQQNAIARDDASAPKRLGETSIDFWPFVRKPQEAETPPAQ
jgi:Domain of unknown function (DUF4410)